MAIQHSLQYYEVENAVKSGSGLSVVVHLEPSLPENTDRTPHELGHVHGFASDMIKYLNENVAGDNCQEIAKKGGTLPFPIKDAIDWQNSYNPNQP